MPGASSTSPTADTSSPAASFLTAQDQLATFTAGALLSAALETVLEEERASHSNAAETDRLEEGEMSPGQRYGAGWVEL